jgi:hypothetical protein
MHCPHGNACLLCDGNRGRPSARRVLAVRLSHLGIEPIRISPVWPTQLRAVRHCGLRNVQFCLCSPFALLQIVKPELRVIVGIYLVVAERAKRSAMAQLPFQVKVHRKIKISNRDPLQDAGSDLRGVDVDAGYDPSATRPPLYTHVRSAALRAGKRQPVAV